jgi:hypothetical protein
MKRRFKAGSAAAHLVLVTVLALAACSPTPPEGAPVSVLLIGNSYSSANDLPSMLTELAAAGGRTLSTELAAEGGWSLADHANSKTTTDAIEFGSWDFVVLQEQSVIPSLREYREEFMFPAARALGVAISSTGAETLLYMTWGRKSGMADIGFAAYTPMQDQITLAYRALGEALGVRVIPAGVAWQRVAGRETGVDLWQSDGSHPTVAGTYLVACVMYASIFEDSPVGISYRAGLSRPEARSLQETAAEVVLESWSFWDFSN